MSDNPFDKYSEPSEYLLPHQSEDESMQNIQNRIAIQENKPRAKQLWIAIAAAASILILLTVSLLWEPTPSLQKLADNSFEPYPNFEYEVVRGENVGSVSKDAYQAYEEGKFIEAKLLFQKLSDKSIEDQFYEAINLQATGDWKSSLDILSLIDHQIKLEFQDAHHWYLALAKMHNNDAVGAEVLLRSLMKTENDFSTKGTQLLDSLQPYLPN